MTRRVLLGLLTMCAAAAPAHLFAQARCDASIHAKSQDSAHHWSAPLNRNITLHAGRVSLRTALDKLASTAGIRLSYSADLLPLGQQRCATYDSVAVGDVLADLLDGAPVEAVVAGAEHVVLAPAHARQSMSNVSNEEAVIALPPFLVAGEKPVVAQRPFSASTEVIEGRQLAQQSVGTVADAINAAVPGLWVWPTTTSSLTAQYGSIRGASSFGPSHPKVYIDGIEVANPLLLTRFSPESIERIEIIRGPEGAALYGGDAINGVTNIITKTEGGADGAHVRWRTNLGVSNNSFAAGPPVSQDHIVSVHGGNATTSGGLNLAFGTVGEFATGGAEHLAADGSVRYTTSRTQLTSTLRFFKEEAGAVISPLLVRSVSGLDSLGAQQPAAALQYTAGMRAQFKPNERWTHSFVLGVDGYGLDDAATEWSAMYTAADSALRAITHGVRGTLRLNSTAQIPLGNLGSAALTFGADHSALQQRGSIEQRPSLDYEMERHPGSGPVPMGTPTRSQSGPGGPAQWSGAMPAHVSTFPPDDDDDYATYEDYSRSNTGFSTQLNATLFDRLSISGGFRVERQVGGGASTHFATLPMVGSAYTFGNGPVSMKLRAAYGKGIRWPELPTHDGDYMRMRAQPLNLAPEEQSGIEGGFDLQLGRTFTLGATRFDQTASGLIQRTTLPGDTAFAKGPRAMWENVGEIGNHGWELQARVERGPIALTGNLSLVDSRVRRLAAGYSGDLQSGDRMLAVPARTMGLTASVTQPDWFVSMTAYRASDWINYDRLGLAQAVVNASSGGTQLTGAQLRSFWQPYDGNTHLRLSMSHTLLRGVTGLLTADNLLNYQRGEPDNSSVVPGRSISIGFRASF